MKAIKPKLDKFASFWLEFCNIKRVEILRRPSGGAYMGEALVVNIVTRKYDFGGYSVLNGSQNALMMSGNYSLLGKFVKGKSTFQFRGGTGINHSFGEHGSTTESYNLTDLKTGAEVSLSRYSKILGSKWLQYSPNAGFQWNKNTATDKWNMILKVGCTQWNNPKMNEHGVVKDYETSEEPYSHRTSSNSISPSIGYFIWWRPDNKSILRINVNGGYSNNKRTSDYILGESAVDYQNKEDVWHFGGNIGFYRQFKYNNSINLYAEFNESFFSARYTGTGRNTSSKFRDSKYKVEANYNKTFYLPNSSWSKISLEGSMPIWVNHFEKGKNSTQVSYFSMLNLNFGIRQKHAIALRLLVTEMPRPLSDMTRQPEMMSDILTLLGNQDLKNNGYWMWSLSYGIYPAKWFNAYAGAGYRRDWNMITNRFFAYEGKLYSQPINSLNESIYSIYWGVSFELLNRSLSIKPSFTASHDAIKGLMNDSFWNIQPSLSIYYMHKSGFSTSLSYSAPGGKKFIKNGDGIRKDYNHSLSIDLSYAKRNFSGSLSVSPFYKYGHSKCYIIQPGVDKITDQWSRSGGRSVSISLRYTIDFGRRYAHGDEMNVYSIEAKSF